ncbi:hypothetical protein PUN28_000051 [Cardiocondyla obscurior]|uniref:Uncharacterized protein n=1 Tax=Cardiocondyla obscurior TaxID=286306 RepID=A0AAW2GXY0_9HYME
MHFPMKLLPWRFIPRRRASFLSASSNILVQTRHATAAGRARKKKVIRKRKASYSGIDCEKPRSESSSQSKKNRISLSHFKKRKTARFYFFFFYFLHFDERRLSTKCILKK